MVFISVLALRCFRILSKIFIIFIECEVLKKKPSLFVSLSSHNDCIVKYSLNFRKGPVRINLLHF